MNQLLKWCSLFFVLLTFLGAGYVLMNRGQVNAGYAVIPMLFALMTMTLYRKGKPK